MGCTNSKLDRLPAISLCRDRCRSLDDVLLKSYVLADAQASYLHSLRVFGGSLGRFVSSRSVPDSVELDRGETWKDLPHPASPGRSSSSSTTSSHIHFHSDSDHDYRQKPALSSFRIGHVDEFFNSVELPNPNFDRLASISYQRSQPAQSFAYIQPIYGMYLSQAITEGLDSKPQPPTPPPPPPPSNSTWDFLNFFDVYDPSGSSGRRLDVFNSDIEAKSIKPETRAATGTVYKKIVLSEAEKTRAAILTAKSEKPVSINPEKRNFPEPTSDGGGKDLIDAMKEVESLFEKASDSGTAVLRLLDNAKFRFRPGSRVHQVSSKVLQAISPLRCLKQGTAVATASSLDRLDSDIVGSEEDAMVGSRNFTSTLKKLYMWEKKLYSEVKAEEKLRMIYSKECKELKHMIEKEQKQPADADRIESTHVLIKNLSTQLKISLHVVDTISARIIKLRDEELWSGLCQLMHGWMEMWRVTADCHRRQRQVIAEAKLMDMILSNQKRDYGFELLEETMQVKLDLQNMELCFCNWMVAQKGCIKALDNWLTKCLSNDPEGLPSLPEVGEPAVFVVSRRWMQTIDASLLMHVTGTMSELVGTIGGVYDDGCVRFHAKALEDKELELKVKALERKNQRMSCEIRRAIKRGTLPSTTEIGNEGGEIGGVSRLRPKLENMFEAMSRYSGHCVETYEELCKLCDEKHLKKA